mmetsp:Transcript_9915/g.24135  ORF Transcript_9915/g.24135 Transcript_9915/m.24135 type:complete len:93 (-) Transcript_9915:768-1046(-)
MVFSVIVDGVAMDFFANVDGWATDIHVTGIAAAVECGDDEQGANEPKRTEPKPMQHILLIAIPIRTQSERRSMPSLSSGRYAFFFFRDYSSL